MVMASFKVEYSEYIKEALKAESQFGFDVRAVARVEPVLGFLFRNWWRIKFQGLHRLPKDGPALIVGNRGGFVPWTQLMLIYALMSNKDNPRRVSIVSDLAWVQDKRVHEFLTSIGFVPWSSDNFKRLFAGGEIVAAFPEGLSASAKQFSDRYRMLEFDWTRLLSAVEEGVPIHPLATLGCEEAVPTFGNIDGLARFLGMPSFPITPFFPWYPFPFNMASLPVPWMMHLLANSEYPQGDHRDDIEETAKMQSKFVQGEIQAELNRLLRARSR
jgi:1-acyl-sn-glycerol-3-phosphate acyltransferase